MKISKCSALILPALIGCAEQGPPNSVDHNEGSTCGINMYSAFIEGQIDSTLSSQIEETPGYKETVVVAHIPVETMTTTYDNLLEDQGIIGLGVQWSTDGSADGYMLYDNYWTADYKPKEGFVCDDKVMAYSFENDLQVVAKCDFTPQQDDPAHFGFCEGNIFRTCDWAADGSDLATTSEECNLLGTFSEATVKVFGLSDDGSRYYPY